MFCTLLSDTHIRVARWKGSRVERNELYNRCTFFLFLRTYKLAAHNSRERRLSGHKRLILYALHVMQVAGRVPVDGGVYKCEETVVSFVSLFSFRLLVI